MAKVEEINVHTQNGTPTKKTNNGNHENNNENYNEIDSNHSGSPNPEYRCDQKGYLEFQKGLKILKYKLLKQLGKGTFSKVFAANDSQTQEYVALKIIRNTEKYQVAARTELKILEFITEVDKENASCCIHLKDSFHFCGHPCLVFKLYGRSLYSFMHDNSYKPFLDRHVKEFAFQIVHAIDFLHSFRIVFTDLKPENIVFVRDAPIRKKVGDEEIWVPSDTRIKLVDFGSAVWDSKDHHYLIQTRHYRAPEVVLGMNWTLPVDIWSIGCVLLELIYGQMVFNTHDSIDHLNQMITMIGSIPRSFVYKIPGDTWEAFFHPLDARLKLEVAKKSRVQCQELIKYFDLEKKDHQLLHELVLKMLKWKPDERILAKKALAHPYFSTMANTENSL